MPSQYCLVLRRSRFSGAKLEARGLPEAATLFFSTNQPSAVPVQPSFAPFNSTRLSSGS